MGTGAASRYKVYKWPEIYPGTQCGKRNSERIRVPIKATDPGKRLKISKKHDKQLTFIDRGYS